MKTKKLWLWIVLSENKVVREIPGMGFTSFGSYGTGFRSYLVAKAAAGKIRTEYYKARADCRQLGMDNSVAVWTKRADSVRVARIELPPIDGGAR